MRKSKQDYVGLEHVFSFDNLKLSFLRYERTGSGNADGKDHYGLMLFKKSLDENLSNLSKRLVNNQFIPSKPFKFLYPKKTLGLSRPYTMLKIEDAIVYQCIADYVAYKNFDKISDKYKYVYSNQLHKDVKLGAKNIELSEVGFNEVYFYKYWPISYNAYKQQRNKIIDSNKSLYILKTDITSYYSSIIHTHLFEKMKVIYQIEKEVIDVLSICLNEYSGPVGSLTPGIGLPQGSQPSSFFAELMLYDIDEEIVSFSLNDDKYLGYARYVDDIEVYSEDIQGLRQTLSFIDNIFRQFSISLNSSKTEILTCETAEQKSEQKKGKGIKPSFLGNEFDLEFIDDIEDKPESMPKDIFDSNSDSLEYNLSHGDLVAQIPDDFENWGLFYDNHIREFEDLIGSEYFVKLFRSNDLLLEKDDVNFIYDNENDLCVRIKVLSMLGNEINKEDIMVNKYLHIWCALSRLFPVKSIKYFYLIKTYFKQDDDFCEQILELYRNLTHSNYAKHKLLDIIISDVQFKLNRTSIVRLLQELIKLNSSDDFLKMALYKTIFIHISETDQIYNRVIEAIYNDDNYIKEWVLFKMNESKDFDVINFSKKIGYNV